MAKLLGGANWEHFNKGEWGASRRRKAGEPEGFSLEKEHVEV